jgi:23S rRNA pseudouridine1911/1915/1917 synthase
MQRVIISEKQAGQRLDRFICDHLKKFSRSKIQKTLEVENLAKVNGIKQKSSYKISFGDEIFINEKTLVKSLNDKLEAESIPIDVIYEDGDFIVVNKPAGLVVHPGTQNKKHTLVNALLSQYPKISEARQNDTEIAKLRPGIAHRLDKDTSGAIVVAKNKKALGHLMGEIKHRRVKKIYQALVFGWTLKSGSLISKISRDKNNRTKMSEGIAGKAAISFFISKKYFQASSSKEKISLLDVEIKTGRTHQIRVQLKSNGHPVLGDNVYKTKESFLLSKKNRIKRQMLHAKSIEFESIKGEKIKVTADLPIDFTELMESLQEV